MTRQEAQKPKNRKCYTINTNFTKNRKIRKNQTFDHEINCLKAQNEKIVCNLC